MILLIIISHTWIFYTLNILYITQHSFIKFLVCSPKKKKKETRERTVQQAHCISLTFLTNQRLLQKLAHKSRLPIVVTSSNTHVLMADIWPSFVCPIALKRVHLMVTKNFNMVPNELLSEIATCLLVNLLLFFFN